MCLPRGLDSWHSVLPGNHPVISDDSLEFLIGIPSLLATWRQQGQQRLVNEHPAVIAECPDDLPENDRLTKSVLGGVVRRGDRWLTDKGEPVVNPIFDLTSNFPSSGHSG